MRRRDEKPRVLGPYWDEENQNYRITTVDPGANRGKGRRQVECFRSLEDAQECKAVTEAKFARLSGVTLAEAITRYEDFLRTKGTGEISYRETCRRLRVFFPDLEEQVARVSLDMARSYYAAFRARLTPKGTPVSVDYHRCALINARSLFTWAIDEGLVGANPFASVKGVGARSAGKEQITGDEMRRLYSLLLPLAAGDGLEAKSALGCLMALLMALRSSDITRRLVRDVDLDATVLRVSNGKTAKSNRPRRVPQVLRPLLRRLIAGRSPLEPLFASSWTASGHHTRRWLEQALEKFCARADVPRVVPHALKGTAGTILAETGESADVIADHLSHEDRATTERHYVAAGAGEDAKAERAFRLILGGLDERSFRV